MNEKKITITGQHNRYQMKKVMHQKSNNKEMKKTHCSTWNFNPKYFEIEEQYQVLLGMMKEKNEEKEENEKDSDIAKIMSTLIHSKINSYKQQDIKRKLAIPTEGYIDSSFIIYSLVQCHLRCAYCNETISLLYTWKRDLKQWSVDRLNNNLCHAKDNCHIVCLECNLKRRRRNHDKFLLSSTLVLVKSEVDVDSNSNDSKNRSFSTTTESKEDFSASVK
jgi:hypothetical protein